MKTTILVALFAAATLVAACDKKEEGGEKTDTSGSSSGVKECDEYYAAVEKCMQNSPDEAKEAFKQGMEQFKTQVQNATDDASKQAVAQGCKAAADALKSNPACQ